MAHDMNTEHIEHIRPVCIEDAEGLFAAESQYRGSWKRRGGVGAYMMACRKWDRIENAIEAEGKDQFDIFAKIAADERAEGLIDDIRDLRRYLVLVEAEMRARGSKGANSTHRDNHIQTTVMPPDYDPNDVGFGRDPGPSGSCDSPNGEVI